MLIYFSHFVKNDTWEESNLYYLPNSMSKDKQTIYHSPSIVTKEFILKPSFIYFFEIILHKIRRDEIKKKDKRKI